MDDTGRHAPAEWHALPDELMLHILTFIDLRDLCNVRVLSRRFCALADDKQCDTSVWRRRYHQYLSLPILIFANLRKGNGTTVGIMINSFQLLIRFATSL